jgi:uncharacterized membrane protein HdeD (DUF308 family)
MIVTSPIDTIRSWTRAQVEIVSSGWWVLIASGIVSIVAGGIIAFADWTVGGLVVFIGTLLIVRGFFTAFSVPVDGSLRTWSVVLGLLEVAVGVSVLVWPDPTLLVVAFYIGWLLMFRGVMTIIGSVASRRFVPYWGVILVAGIVEVLVAFFLLGRPGLTLVATVLAVGLTAVFYGVLEVVLAFEVKRLPDRFDELTGTSEGRTDTDRSLDAVA